MCSIFECLCYKYIPGKQEDYLFEHGESEKVTKMIYKYFVTNRWVEIILDKLFLRLFAACRFTTASLLIKL